MATEFVTIEAGGLKGDAGHARDGYEWEVRGGSSNSTLLARGRCATFDQARAALIAVMRALVSAQAAALGGTVDWHSDIQGGAQ